MRIKKVLVIGDSCEDVFQYGVCERLSPEAPVPIFNPTMKNSNHGMAGNVYMNLLSLGIEADLISNTGITKTRIVDEVSNQILVRIDENDGVDEIRSDFLEGLDFTIYDAIIISDYNKGFISQANIQYISTKHNMVFLDTKKKLGKWVDNIDFIKINEIEYKNNTQYLDLFYRNNLIVTLGGRGAYLRNKSIKKEFPIEKSHSVRDLSGAGDTFLAGLVAEFIKSNDISKAIIFANKCASWAVSQKGVVIVDLKGVSDD